MECAVAYALIAWEAPADADAAAIDQDLLQAITLDDGARVPVQFLDHLVLYPSRPGGIGFSQVKARVQEVVARHPGLQLVIIMPQEGTQVRGWFDPAKNLDAARPIMNESGNTFPAIIR